MASNTPIYSIAKELNIESNRILLACKSIGINAVELMPITEFPGTHSWGYDPVSYTHLTLPTILRV